jgi:hypothetical protein
VYTPCHNELKKLNDCHYKKSKAEKGETIAFEGHDGRLYCEERSDHAHWADVQDHKVRFTVALKH